MGSFGKDWVNDIVNQLNIKDVTLHQAAYGLLPNLDAVNFDNGSADMEQHHFGVNYLRQLDC